MGLTGLTNANQRVLVVEDDAEMVRLLRRALWTVGFESVWAGDGLGAVQAVREEHPALVLLDLILPRLDGFEVCKRLRAESQVPIIVISGRGSDEDKLYAFNLGADDYLAKPFHLGELIARVRAVLRRSNHGSATIGIEFLRCGDLEIDFSARIVRGRGAEVHVTPFEFDLLKVLAMNRGKVLTHAGLLKQVWGPEYGEEREYLRVHLSHLRRKIEPNPANPKYIQTVARVGYRFMRGEPFGPETPALASGEPGGGTVTSLAPRMAACSG